MNANSAKHSPLRLLEKMPRGARLAGLLVVLAAVLGMALVWVATRAGPGVGGDATIYLTTARNFLHGEGLGWVDADGSYRLLPYSPPFYPLALSAVGLVILDMTNAARVLNVAVWGATLLLIGLAFYRFTKQPWLAGLLAGILAASPVLLGVEVWAMSEPLFLLTGFAGLLLIVAYLLHPQARWWGLSAVLVGLSALTRYAGVAFIGAAGLALLLLGTGPLGQRWTRALRYGLLALLPLLVWLVIDLALTGSVGSRSGQPASAYVQRLLEMGPALESIYLFWLLPDSLIARLPGIVRMTLWLLPALAAVGAGLWLLRPSAWGGRGLRRPASPAGLLALVMLLFIGVYMLVLVLVQVFTYPPVTLASRVASPVHLAVWVLLLALTALLITRAEETTTAPATASATAVRRGWKMLSVLLVGLLLAAFGLYAARSALIAREYLRTGIGYNAPLWRDAPIVEVVRSLPADVPLISNETTALMYLVDRPAYALQEIFADQPLAEFNVYGSGADAAQQAFRQQDAALVLFYATLEDDFAMYGSQREARLAELTRGLRPMYLGEDGAIYFYR